MGASSIMLEVKTWLVRLAEAPVVPEPGVLGRTLPVKMIGHGIPLGPTARKVLMRKGTSSLAWGLIQFVGISYISLCCNEAFRYFFYSCGVQPSRRKNRLGI